MRKKKFLPHGLSPPIASSWRGEDGGTLRLLGGESFDPGLVVGVPRRCVFGVPQVVACAPLRRGKPFPTNWWLLCPFLREACAREEERGGVQELENYLLVRQREWRRYARRHALWRLACLSPSARRFLFRHRPGFWRALISTGPGGIGATETPRVKCLHLQVASWLVWPDHPGGVWLAERFPLLWCSSPERCGGGRGGGEVHSEAGEIRCP